MAQMKGFISKSGRKVLTEADRVAMEREKMKLIPQTVSPEMKSVAGIMDYFMDAVEELNRTVQVSASVMEAVLKNTESVKQFVLRSNETGWLNTNALQKAMQNTEMAMDAVKRTVDTNSSAMRKYLEAGNESMRLYTSTMQNSAVTMQKAVAELKDLKAFILSVSKVIEGSSEVIRINKDFMQSIKKSLDDSRSSINLMTSAMNTVNKSINGIDDSIQMNSHVIQLVVDKLRDISVAPSKEVTSNQDWSNLTVVVSERDYKGSIKKLEIKKT